MGEKQQIIRKVIHIDMDAFYASIEQRDNPQFRNKPIAVGGSSQRGVVAAASYEARKFGVFSAMPSSVAARKCPDLIFVKPRFNVYREVSQHIRTIFYEYTDLVEPLSLDEAYLDVTENKKEIPSASIIAKQIKQRIKRDTHLTASAGVSCNKFLAKIASDYDKPDGFYVIKPTKAEQFVEKLPIEKFHGIGKVTAEKMHKMNISNGLDLKRYSKETLIKYFGKVGLFYFQIARGIDNRAVNPHRERKSVGAENTFYRDLTQADDMKEELSRIIKKVNERLLKADVYGKTVTLKIRYHDFTTFSRSKTLANPIREADVLRRVIFELLDQYIEDKPVRLLGVTMSNLVSKNRNYQLKLDFN